MADAPAKKDDKKDAAVSAEAKGIGAITLIILALGGLYFLKLVGDGKINLNQEGNYLTQPRSTLPPSTGVQMIAPDQYSQ